MILQLQAKVHGLGYLGVSTCTYANLSNFKATFWIPSSLTRTLRSKGGRSLLSWELLGRSAPWLVRRLIGWFLGCLVCWLVGWSSVFFWLLVCWLAGSLADWMASWQSNWMAYLLSLLPQIAWLCFDDLLGSLVSVLTWFEIASPPLIALNRMIICFVRSLTSSVRLLAWELTELLYLACILARFLFLLGFNCFA